MQLVYPTAFASVTLLVTETSHILIQTIERGIQFDQFIRLVGFDTSRSTHSHTIPHTHTGTYTHACTHTHRHKLPTGRNESESSWTHTDKSDGVELPIHPFYLVSFNFSLSSYETILKCLQTLKTFVLKKKKVIRLENFQI